MGFCLRTNRCSTPIHKQATNLFFGGQGGTPWPFWVRLKEGNFFGRSFWGKKYTFSFLFPGPPGTPGGGYPTWWVLGGPPSPEIKEKPKPGGLLFGGGADFLGKGLYIRGPPFSLQWFRTLSVIIQVPNLSSFVSTHPCHITIISVRSFFLFCCQLHARTARARTRTVTHIHVNIHTHPFTLTRTGALRNQFINNWIILFFRVLTLYTSSSKTDSYLSRKFVYPRKSSARGCVIVRGSPSKSWGVFPANTIPSYQR